MLNAEAQIDAANARLARALKAEDQLKERWLMLEEQVKANQQEKTAAQATLQQLTSKVQPPRDSSGTNPRAHRNNVALGTNSTESERDGTSSLFSLGTIQVTQKRAQQEERHERAQSDWRPIAVRKDGARGGRRPRHQHGLKPCRAPGRMVRENAKAGQGRRRNDRESSAGISPGWTDLGMGADLDCDCLPRQNAAAMGPDTRIPW